MSQYIDPFAAPPGRISGPNLADTSNTDVSNDFDDQIVAGISGTERAAPWLIQGQFDQEDSQIDDLRRTDLRSHRVFFPFWNYAVSYGTIAALESVAKSTSEKGVRLR
jgi:hypothetical protein